MANLFNTFLSTDTMVIEHCCNCGIKFAFTQDYYKRVKQSGNSFYCPNGHRQHYTESDVQRLQKQVEQLERSKQYLNDAITNKNERIQNLEHQKRAIKAAKTRMANRVKNGVCPCCNRTFENLQRHMKSQHPEFNHTK